MQLTCYADALTGEIIHALSLPKLSSASLIVVEASGSTSITFKVPKVPISDGNGQTLGFALAKGLIRGLTRCQPAVEILTYYLFLDVS